MNLTASQVKAHNKGRPFSRDGMHSAASVRVASAAMSVIDALQVRYFSEEQVLGVAAVFLTLCDRFNVTPQDAFAATTNLMNHRVAGITGKRPEFLAVEMYARDEL